MGVFAMTSAIVPKNYATRPLRNSVKANNIEESSYVRAIVTIVSLLAKAIGSFFLLGLLVVTGLVWLWLASFRTGSRFGAWIYSFWAAKGEDQNKLTLDLTYSFVLTLIAPVAIFSDWAQKVISERFQITCPPSINLREVIKAQLGLDLPENSLCLPEESPIVEKLPPSVDTVPK
jgi:hypothetical protein